jgi:hypothetical protein
MPQSDFGKGWGTMELGLCMASRSTVPANRSYVDRENAVSVGLVVGNRKCILPSLKNFLPIFRYSIRGIVV